MRKIRKDYPVNIEHRQAVCAKVQECTRMFEEYFGVEINKQVVALFNLKGKTAGYANYTRRYIRVNVDILLKYGDTFINEVIPHEMAHIFTDYCYEVGIYNLHKAPSAHGVQWRNMMRILGIDSPKRCHTFECQPAKKMRRWAYNCDCTVHSISTTLHNRMQKGQGRICANCRTKLSFSGKQIV